MTAHKLRHTYACVLTALRADPAYVSGQLGHTDARFTLTVYSDLVRRGATERQALARLAGAQRNEDGQKACRRLPGAFART